MSSRVDFIEMAGFRTFAVAVLSAGLWFCAGSLAFADPPATPHKGHHHNSDATSAPSHGAISGVVAGVDYALGSITVSTSHGEVPVAVTPTTSIFHGSRFASFADVQRGAHVTVDFSASDGRLIAQIIRIR